MFLGRDHPWRSLLYHFCLGVIYKWRFYIIWKIGEKGSLGGFKKVPRALIASLLVILMLSFHHFRGKMVKTIYQSDFVLFCHPSDVEIVSDNFS